MRDIGIRVDEEKLSRAMGTLTSVITPDKHAQVHRIHVFRRIPEGVEIGSRLWISVNGVWVGYFLVGGVGMRRSLFGYVPREIRFYSESFVPNPQEEMADAPLFLEYTYRVPTRSDVPESVGPFDAKSHLTRGLPWESARRPF